MESYENIDKMYCKFNDIIKDLAMLGKEYIMEEKNRKILNALSKDWESKITVIEEAKDLSTMSTESPINSLASYELKLKSKTQDKEDARMKKSITLKASQEEDDSFSLIVEDIDVDNNDLTFLTKKFKRMLNKRKFRKEGPNNLYPNQLNNQRGKGKQETSKKQSEKCYECGQLGYYLNECPMKKTKENKGKETKIQ